MMTKRRSQSDQGLDDLLVFLRVVPWWVGPPLMLFVWFLCHTIVPVVIRDYWPWRENPFTASGLELLSTLSVRLSPVLAGVVGFVWIVALFTKMQDRHRLGRQSGASSIRSLSWREFELLLAEAYLRKGYLVEDTGGVADGGLDLILTRRGQTTLVQANVVGHDIGGFVEETQERIAEDIELPAGYFINWGGQFELAQQANRRLLLVVPITLGLICLLLYASFGSIKSTLLILLNIPLALVGGLIGLWFFGENLSVPASVGFIALFGLALENGMVLVTYLNQLIGEGRSIAQASMEGASLRVRPVLMTDATTALGLIPLLLATGTGSEVQRPVAIMVLGGLISSTALTLLVLPAVYRWFVHVPESADRG